jgi:hypothetical protein
MAYYKCGKIFATQNSNTSIATASGAIANFSTSLAMPVLGCIAEFSASQASGTPTPSAPIPIVGVDKVAMYNGGKNLIDLSTMVSGYVTTTGAFSSAHSMGEMRSDFIPVKPNTRYTFAIKATSSTYDSWCGIGLYKDNNISSFIVRRTNLLTFTTTEDTRFIVVSARNIADASKIQLEQGSEATDYEPYNGTTALINLGGTYYGGSVDAVTGKITLTQGYDEFDGSSDENWVLNSKNEANNWSRFAINVTNIAICENTDLQNRCYSNIFEKTNANTIIQTVNVNKIAVISNQRLLISLPYTTAQSVAELRTWLANNHTQVVYELATPLVVYASNTAELLTKAGLNNIFCDTGDIEVKYRRINNDL